MEDLLIEKIKEHRVLYDVYTIGYRDERLRQRAWEEIGKELQISVTEVRSFWDDLISRMCDTRNMHKDVPEVNNPPYKEKTLSTFEQKLSFLIPRSGNSRPQEMTIESQDLVELMPESDDMCLHSRRSQEMLYDSEAMINLEAESVCLSDEESGDIEHSLLDTKTKENSQDNRAKYDKSTFNEAEMSKILNKSLKPMKKEILVEMSRNSSALGKCLFKGLKTLKASRPTLPTSLTEHLDDTDLFFISMSRMTKKLPRLKQSQIKAKLSNLVLSAEISFNQ